MSKLTPQQKSFVALIVRSEDKGDGWRQVSKAVWPLVAKAALPTDLLEVDADTLRVRFTDAGNAVAAYV
jgi:acetamidase/formamidase